MNSEALIEKLTVEINRLEMENQTLRSLVFQFNQQQAWVNLSIFYFGTAILELLIFKMKNF